MYTLQLDRHGNTIVCKGSEERNGYRIVARGTYNECNAMRASAASTPEALAAAAAAYFDMTCARRTTRNA